MLIRFVVAAAFLCFGPALAYVEPDKVQDLEHVPVPVKVGKPLPPAEVRDSILWAATAKNWKVDYVGAGRLTGKLTVRDRHMIEVAIVYTPQEYSIVYRDSLNMNFNPKDGTIHPNYNRWVGELRQAIDSALRKAAAY